MKNVLNKLGTVFGYLGILTCLVGAFGYCYGDPTFQGLNATGIYIGGIGLITAGCWAKLESK